VSYGPDGTSINNILCENKEFVSNINENAYVYTSPPA
jgi:hypothetical protein